MMVSRPKTESSPFFKTNLKQRLVQNFTVGAVDPENPQEAIEQAAAAEESKNGAYLSEKSRSRTFKSSDSEDDGAAAFMEDKKD